MRTVVNSLIVGTFAIVGLMEFTTQALAGCVPDVLTGGGGNTCIGTGSLVSNVTGKGNTAIGGAALTSNTEGENNTALGMSLRNNTIGNGNTASGVLALNYNISGNYNTASGYSALMFNTTGMLNTAFGNTSLASNKTGNYNTATGSIALAQNTSGSTNSAYGMEALNSNTTGSNNTALGYQAGINLTIGNNNIAIGNKGVAGESATIRIGTANTQTRTFVAGISGATITGASVLVNSSGRLGVASSSRRFKEEIMPMGDLTGRMMNLRPVTFRYKEPDDQGNKPLQYGLIAEEVDGTMPELVVRNEFGSPETVAYHVLPSLLLNEYQKQQRDLIELKDKLSSAETKLSTAEERLAALEGEVFRMKTSVERLMAQASGKTKLAVAE